VGGFGDDIQLGGEGRDLLVGGFGDSGTATAVSMDVVPTSSQQNDFW